MPLTPPSRIALADDFDAQARSEQLTIITADRRIAAYNVPLIDTG